MYVRDLLLSLLRRWYVLVAGLLVTGALCGFAFIKIPLTYEATGSVLLLPPKSSVGSRGNPYLYLGGLAQAVEVLTARINASQLRKPIADAHPEATVDVGQDQQSTGPLLSVTVSTHSEAETLTVIKAVMDQVPGALTSMQDDLTIPEGSRIGSLVLTDPTEATELSRTRSRTVIALAGVGVAGTILLAGLIDGFFAARTRRRTAAQEPAEGWTVGSGGGEPPKPGPGGNGSGGARSGSGTRTAEAKPAKSSSVSKST